MFQGFGWRLSPPRGPRAASTGSSDDSSVQSIALFTFSELQLRDVFLITRATRARQAVLGAWRVARTSQLPGWTRTKNPPVRGDDPELASAAREALGAGSGPAWAEGRALAFEDAMALALPDE
jgi:hypothetical protein